MSFAFPEGLVSPRSSTGCESGYHVEAFDVTVATLLPECPYESWIAKYTRLNNSVQNPGKQGNLPETDKIADVSSRYATNLLTSAKSTFSQFFLKSHVVYVGR